MPKSNFFSHALASLAFQFPNFLISFFILILFSIPALAQFPSTATHNFSGCAFPDTGQVLCYDASNSPGPCPGGFAGNGPYGQDGDYSTAASSPSYTIYSPTAGSSVAVDNRTGLMWEINGGCALGFAQLWVNAAPCCNNMVYAGFSDWRLPNIRELVSLLNFGGSTAHICNWAFPDTLNAGHWSSTTVPTVSTSAFSFYFLNGNGRVLTDGKVYARAVRCVRGGW